MGKTAGRSGRTGGKKNKSLTSKKKKPTNNLSMKRRAKEQERSHDLKIKVILHRPATVSCAVILTTGRCSDVKLRASAHQRGTDVK